MFLLIKIVFLLIAQNFLLKILLIEKCAYLCPISFFKFLLSLTGAKSVQTVNPATVDSLELPTLREITAEEKINKNEKATEFLFFLQVFPAIVAEEITVP